MPPIVTIGGIHLVNSTGAPVAGGASTAAATTGFAIREGWSLQTAPQTPVWSGTPPFRYGADLVALGYANVTETIPISIHGANHENAVALLQELKRVLSAASTIMPAVMGVQPTGSSNTMYTNVLAASVQEVLADDTFEAWEGWSALYADLTLTRAPFWGWLSAGDTLIAGASFRNTGTGSPDNLEALPVSGGDMTYEGGPLNVAITPAAGGFNRMYAATVQGRTYTTTGAAVYATASTTGTTAYTVSHTLTPLLTNMLLAPRVLVRYSAYGSNVQARLSVSYAGVVFFRGPWVTPSGIGAGLLDLGTYPIAAFARHANGITSPAASVTIQTRSTDGVSASLTVTYTELLLCYTWARMDASIVTALSPLVFDSYPEQTGYPCLPHGRPLAFTRTSNNVDSVYVVRGTLPRYYTGASLYLAWIDTSDTHVTTAAATVTATHAPLFKTLRGFG